MVRMGRCGVEGCSRKGDMETMELIEWMKNMEIGEEGTDGLEADGWSGRGWTEWMGSRGRIGS
jgi:hypothetical protein